MAAILKLHKATIGSTTYFFLQSPTGYDGSIDTATGVSEATDAEQDEPATSVTALVSKGKLFRAVIEYSDGTIRKRAKLLIARDKLSTALDSLEGETFRGGTITSVRIPQKAQFF